MSMRITPEFRSLRSWHAVWPEVHLAAVVAVGDPLDDEVLAGRIAFAVLHLVAEDAVLLLRFRVFRAVRKNIDEVRFCVAGVEAQGVEPHPLELKEGLGLLRGRIVRKRQDAAVLDRDQRAARRRLEGHIQRIAEGQLGEGPFRLVGQRRIRGADDARGRPGDALSRCRRRRGGLRAAGSQEAEREDRPDATHALYSWRLGALST
jgi:hypothetical protein